MFVCCCFIFFASSRTWTKNFCTESHAHSDILKKNSTFSDNFLSLQFASDFWSERIMFSFGGEWYSVFHSAVIVVVLFLVPQHFVLHPYLFIVRKQTLYYICLFAHLYFCWGWTQAFKHLSRVLRNSQAKQQKKKNTGKVSDTKDLNILERILLIGLIAFVNVLATVSA